MKRLFISDRLKPLSLFCLILGMFLLTGSFSAWACDIEITTSFVGVGYGFNEETEHEDSDPFKGWIDLTVTNKGDEAWGDFHFEIFEARGYSIENVYFIDSTGYEPEKDGSQDGLTWYISPDGHSLDLYFYSDPVEKNEVVNIKVYTDNTTDEVPFFGTLYYPTPTPIPSAVWLLASGLIGLTGLRKRFQTR